MKNQAFEPIVLAVCLGLLALVAAGLAYTFPSIEELTTVTSLEPNGHVVAEVTPDTLQTQLAPLAKPALWNVPDDNHRLFLSDRYLFYASLYPSGNYLQKDDGTAVTPGGVLISWLRKYHLNITDPSIDREDPDKDGFSNKTEFFNDSAPGSRPDGTKSTNPLDPDSHPAYLSRLRLAKYDVRPFHIEFVGVVSLNGTNEFQITLTDVPPSGQPPLKKTGDPLNYEDWIVGAYTPKLVQVLDKGTGIMEPDDESTLELDKPDIGRKVILPLRKIINSEESTAHFSMLMPSEVNKDIVVARGKAFQLPEDRATQYLLIDVGDTGATIRDMTDKKDIHVPKLDPAEWNDVPLPPAATTNTRSP
jgi:hypothetical protein